MDKCPQIAALDLGSNSFRLEIGRVEGAQVYVQDSVRSNVRLAAGLGTDKRLDEAAQLRGLESLSRFAQRIAGFPATRVRAVATNTLRVARNAGEFIARAQTLLGFPIEVIAGREEARLIFNGVAHSVPANQERRLVVDIGGGSTEFSVGTGFEPALMESLYVGAINSTLLHFPDGFIDDFTLKQAELAARREIEVIAAGVRESGWTVAIASSGTARTIARLLAEHNGGDGTIGIAGMRWLRRKLVAAGNIDRIAFAGLKFGVFGYDKLTLVKTAVQVGRVVTSIAQRDADAANQALVTITLHEARDARPQEHDDGAVAMFPVNAGAAGLDRGVAQMVQAREVELRFRIKTADAARRLRRQQAIRAHHAAVARLAHQKVFAERIEHIAVQPLVGIGQARTHFVGEYLEAQTLHFGNFTRTRGEREGVALVHPDGLPLAPNLWRERQTIFMCQPIENLHCGHPCESTWHMPASKVWRGDDRPMTAR